MKLREVQTATGISKRNIHYYVQQGLLHPTADDQNGYYDFTEQDCRRLLTIRALRNGDFSIAQIRAMLDAPSTSVYYLNLRLSRLREEQARLAQVEESLDYIRQRLPLHPEYDSLERLILQANIPAEADTSGGGAPDNNELVNRYLWESFLPSEPFNDYQEYLWSKLNRLAAGQYAAEFRSISAAMHSFSQREIEAIFADNRALYRKVTALTPDDYDDYVYRMQQAIGRFLHSAAALRHWKKRYRELLLPTTIICDSELSRTMAELSPFFAQYQRNVREVCGRMYRWLQTPEGQPLRREIERLLPDMCDIDHHSHGLLQAMENYAPQ